MALVIFASFGLLILSVSMIIYAGVTDSPVFGSIGGIFSLISGVGLIACIAYGFDWHASEYKAKIMNREYGTSYTQDEVFYASSVIETVRELDRKRMEINGDIITGK